MILKNNYFAFIFLSDEPTFMNILNASKSRQSGISEMLSSCNWLKPASASAIVEFKTESRGGVLKINVNFYVNVGTLIPQKDGGDYFGVKKFLGGGKKGYGICIWSGFALTDAR